jgi:hypothetical protein
MLEGQLEAPRLGMLSPLPQAGRMLVDPEETICLAARRHVLMVRTLLRVVYPIFLFIAEMLA